MSESEKKTEWRDIWQEIIETSRMTLKNQKMNYTLFNDIEDKYPKDKMIIFEKAITAECLGDYPTAKEYYEKASNEENGLPVKHWRERAGYFLNRLIDTGKCHTFGELDNSQELRNVQLDTYYNVHSYYHLNDYIRYLAISSISRLTSEPAMAIVIFRTCLEISIWTYFEKEANEINEVYQIKWEKDSDWEIDLRNLLKELKKNTPFIKKNYDLFYRVKDYGNKAAHPGKMKEEAPYKYTNKDLITILEDFNNTLLQFDNYVEKNCY